MYSRSILNEELLRLKQLLKRLNEMLADLPKGSISDKYRNGVKYCYWARREDKKIVFAYIGKDGSEPVIQAQEQRNEQLKLRERIKYIKAEIIELERINRGSRR